MWFASLFVLEVGGWFKKQQRNLFDRAMKREGETPES